LLSNKEENVEPMQLLILREVFTLYNLFRVRPAFHSASKLSFLLST